MPAPQIQTVPIEYKPWGLTAGAMVGQQQYDTEAANLQALNEARLANVGHERDAMLAQGQMDNPAWLQSKIAGEIGVGQSQEAQGAYDKGALKSKLSRGIAENLAGASEAQYKQLMSQGNKQLLDLKLAVTRLNSPEAQNPALITEVLQKYGTSMGFPPEMHQQLLQAEQQKPGTIKQALGALIGPMQEAMAITPQVYAEMAKDKNKIQEEEIQTKSKDRAARSADSKYSADMHYKAAMARIAGEVKQAEKSMSTDQVAGLMFRRAAETTDPIEQKAWMDSYNILISDIRSNKEAPARVKSEADAAAERRFIEGRKGPQPGIGGKPLGTGTASDPIRLGG